MKYCSKCMSPIEATDVECPFCGSAINAEIPLHHLAPGTILNNKFMVGAALGEGGFGITYIGRDTKLDMKVAIKEFFPKGIVGRNAIVSSKVLCLNADESCGLFDTEKAKAINEARILAKFSKERGIVNVREYFEANNTAYIVMEYLEGKTLEEYLASSGPISPNQAYMLLYPVMRVLGLLHEENVVHRDISPDNLMFDGDQIKLLDFGAAREILYSTSKSFSVILKHGYAPEEQYRRKGHQGAWTDVYSLCATIYYCITNVVPDTSLDRMHEDELKCPSDLGIQITQQQEEALMRGLSVLPEDRLQKVSDFIAVWNGELVPLPNPQKETVVVFNNNTASSGNLNKRVNAAGAETVCGGQVNYASVESDERKVSGYYVSTDISSSANSDRVVKLKKKLRTVILSSIIAIILIVAIVFIGWILANREDDRKPQNSTSGTTQITLSDEENTTNEQEITTSTTTTTTISTTTATSTTPMVDMHQEYIDKADELVAQNKFDEAVAELDTAEQLYGAHSTITTKRSEVIKTKGLYALNQYEALSDFKSAIKYIDENMQEYASDADIVSKRNLYVTKYRTQILSGADIALIESGYSEAIQIVNDGLSVLPDDSTLLAKIEEYKAYVPVSLRDLTRTNGKDYSFKDSAKDPRGTVYSDVLLLESYWQGGWDYPILAGEVEFYTARKYSVFECALIPNYDFSKSDNAKGGQLQIYADDKLVYTSETLFYKTNGINVSVNIGNAEYVTIKVVNNSYESNYCASMFLADAIVKK